MKQILLRSVPDDLHKKVRMAALQAGISMQAFIIEAMAAAVKGKK